jgi:hypothetical protein
MCPVVRISDETFARLESLASGFDTPAKVIEKLLDDKGVPKPPKTLERLYDEVVPTLPRHSFRKLHKIELWAKKQPRPEVAKVIQTYLDLCPANSGTNSSYFIAILEEKGVYGGDEQRIRNNLAQLKNDDGKQHGKVFYENDKGLHMHQVVFAEAKKYFDFSIFPNKSLR